MLSVGYLETIILRPAGAKIGFGHSGKKNSYSSACSSPPPPHISGFSSCCVGRSLVASVIWACLLCLCQLEECVQTCSAPFLCSGTCVYTITYPGILSTLFDTLASGTRACLWFVLLSHSTAGRGRGLPSSCAKFVTTGMD